MNLQSKESKELVIFLSIALLIILVFSFMLFGVAGIRVVLGIIFVSLPFYLMLNNLKLNEAEKFVFSIMLGLTVFPSLVYLLGLVVSFRIAIMSAFVLFFTVAMVISKYKPKKAE